jgi:hypothetical protein
MPSEKKVAGVLGVTILALGAGIFGLFVWAKKLGL